jgi:hypothetical protein
VLQYQTDYCRHGRLKAYCSIGRVCVCVCVFHNHSVTRYPAVQYVSRVHLATRLCVITNNDAEKCVAPHDCDVHRQRYSLRTYGAQNFLLFSEVITHTVCWTGAVILSIMYNGRGQLQCDGTRAETRFLLSAKRTSPFKSAGASVQSTTGSRGVRISGSNAGYTMFRGSVKSTGYPLHSPVSPSLPLLCVTVCHHISTGLYLIPSEYFDDCTRNQPSRLKHLAPWKSGVWFIILTATVRCNHIALRVVKQNLRAQMSTVW